MKNPSFAIAVAALMLFGSTSAKAQHQPAPSDLNRADRLDRTSTLVAQAPASWCYTNYGRYPMMVAMPPGYACQVNVPFWPYIVAGVTGY